MYSTNVAATISGRAVFDVKYCAYGQVVRIPEHLPRTPSLSVALGQVITISRCSTVGRLDYPKQGPEYGDITSQILPVLAHAVRCDAGFPGAPSRSHPLLPVAEVGVLCFCLILDTAICRRTHFLLT